MSGSGINDIKPKIWDIIKAKVYFDDSMNYKERPVLVLDEINNVYCSLKITSNTERQGLSEYGIMLWKEAGLNKKSNIRLNKFFVLNSNSIIGKYGILQVEDRKNLIKQMYDFIILNQANYTKSFIQKIENGIDKNVPPPLCL